MQLKKDNAAKTFFILVFFVLFLLNTVPVKASYEKYALIRLEDVSPWYATNPTQLDNLYHIADYLYSKHVPFSVSMIPCYVNLQEKVFLSIGDLDNPTIQKFVEAIKYMQSKGGVIGLHGYTHQNGEGVTAVDYEFSKDPKSPIGTVSYMKDHVEKAISAAQKAGIPISYWETPHYTASLEQYKYLEGKFSILYEPDHYRFSKKPYLVKSENPKIGKVFYIPTSLDWVRGQPDVDRLVTFASHPNDNVLASFFFHPKVNKDASHDPFLEEIIPAFQKNGFTFITPIELRNLMITTIILNIGNPNITVNGTSKKIDAQGSKPIIQNGRTILPIRTLIESLGGTVDWNAKEQKVTITLNGHSIVLCIGKTTALVDGSKTTLDVAPQIINGRTYIPLRFVSEHLGASVNWDGTTQTITIYYWP